MASMDNLRDKIRSRRADTSELDAAPTPAPAAALAQTYDEIAEPAFSGSNTDSLISEIFADQTQVPAFGPDVDKPKSAPKAEPKPKKALELPFMNRFKQLEVNRKMLIVSLGVAALASFLSMAYLKGIAEPLKGQSRMVKVVTLAQDVPARTELSEKMLEIKDVPAAYIPEGALEYKPNLQLLGQVTTTALYKGEILHSQRISLPNQEAGITTVIPAKHRAMTVRTNNAALIHPSTRDRKEYIDLIASIPDPNPVRQGKLITYPILQRALVLAVGNQLSDSERNASSAPSTTITLAVPEERVNLMVMLEEKGDFKVIPRSPDDESILPEKYTITEIEDAMQGRFEAAAPPSASKSDPVEKAEAPLPPDPPQAQLRDLSGGAAPAYRAPARNYRAPVRSAPVYRAPVYRAPVRSYRAPSRAVSRPAAAPRAAAAAPASRPRTRMPRMTIQGGSVTQSGN